MSACDPFETKAWPIVRIERADLLEGRAVVRVRAARAEELQSLSELCLRSKAVWGYDQSIRSYCNRIDWSRSIVFGCFVDCVLRGVGELQVESPGPNRKAEITSTVEGPYQGRGVGTELFRRLIEVGRERSIKTLYLTILPDNEKALRTVRKFGAELEVRHGEMKGRVSASETPRSSRQRND